MNSRGLAVGWYSKGTVNKSFGFTLSNGKLKLHGPSGAQFTYIYGINDNGLAVGSVSYFRSGYANVYTFDTVTDTWTDLKFPYPYSLMHPVGISNTGVIALTEATGGLWIATPSN